MRYSRLASVPKCLVFLIVTLFYTRTRTTAHTRATACELALPPLGIVDGNEPGGELLVGVEHAHGLDDGVGHVVDRRTLCRVHRW
jgi:hypothetical protein